MAFRGAIATAVVLVAVTGCGGSGDGAPAQQADPTPVTTAAAPVDDAATIAKTVGCDTPLRRDKESMAQEEHTCRVKGEGVNITRFSDLDTANQFIELGSSFGANYALVNDNWTVSSRDRALVKRLAADNGWQVK